MQPFNSHRRLAQVSKHAPQVPNRPDVHVGGKQEEEELTGAKRTARNQRQSNHQYHQNLRQARHITQRPKLRKSVKQANVSIAMRRVPLTELRAFKRLPPKRAHHPDACNVLLRFRGQASLGLIFRAESITHRAEVQTSESNHRNRQHRGRNRHAPIDSKHQRYGNEQQQYRPPHFCNLICKHILHSVHITGGALQEIATFIGIKEGHR